MSRDRSAGMRELPIVQYWDADTPPDAIAELLASFRRHNPERPHMVFSESAAERFIAEHHSEREVTAFRACAVPAMQADYLRYAAVLALGGIYSDADYGCVAALDPLLDATEGGSLFQAQNGLVTNALFAFSSPGHPLLRLALDIATANIERRVDVEVLRATGPGIFTSLHLLNRHGSIDAFLDFARGGKLELTAGVLCEVVERHDRVAEAFATVSVEPKDRIWSWVRLPETRPAYKRTAGHWPRFKGTIYRPARSPAPGS